MLDVFFALLSVVIAVGILLVAGLLAAIVCTLADWIAHSQAYVALQDRRSVRRVRRQLHRIVAQDCELRRRRDARLVFDQDHDNRRAA